MIHILSSNFCYNVSQNLKKKVSTINKYVLLLIIIYLLTLFIKLNYIYFFPINFEVNKALIFIISYISHLNFFIYCKNSLCGRLCMF